MLSSSHASALEMRDTWISISGYLFQGFIFWILNEFTKSEVFLSTVELQRSMTFEYFRFVVVLMQTVVAHQLETRDAWSLLLNHDLDMVMLCGGANEGLQTNAPFLMLSLKCDDFAYCYCRQALGELGGQHDTDTNPRPVARSEACQTTVFETSRRISMANKA